MIGSSSQMSFVKRKCDARDKHVPVRFLKCIAGKIREHIFSTKNQNVINIKMIYSVFVEFSIEYRKRGMIRILTHSVFFTFYKMYITICTLTGHLIRFTCPTVH